MNINWSTVFFQIINFLIIVYILKRYLFKPVLSSMQKREDAIQKRLKDAENLKKLAEVEKQNLKVKLFDLEKSKNDILAEAYKKTLDQQKSIMDKFNIDMQNKKNLFLKNLKEERENLNASVKEIAAQTIINTISFALRDFANIDIQNAIIDNFFLKLKESSLPKIDELKSFYAKSKKIQFISSFELDAIKKDQLLNSFSSILGEKINNFEFIIDKSLICGIQVICDSLLISFGLDNYVNDLKSNLDSALTKLTKTNNVDELK